jgi:transcriptional regulator NrdR family protein
MKCPTCKIKMKCFGTRHPGLTVTRRSYLCDSCGKRFYSTELFNSDLPEELLRRVSRRPRIPKGGIEKEAKAVVLENPVVEDDDWEDDLVDEDWEDDSDWDDWDDE